MTISVVKRAWPTSMARIALLSTLFLLSFGLVARVVACLAGDPELGELTEKLRYFTAHKDRYDVVFVGSSRVKRGVIPVQLDARLAAQGLTVRSFNFGVAGMKPHLAKAVIRRILATEPERLRWLVVELGTWDPRLRPANRFKRRTIFWHDATETRAVLDSTLRAELPFVARTSLALTHVLHFAARATGAGRGRDFVLRRWRETGPPEDLPRQGFEPYVAGPPGAPSRNLMRRRFLQQIDAYRHAVDKLAAGTSSDSSGDRYNLAVLEEQSTMIRRAGVVPLSLITPIPRPTPELTRLEGLGLIPGLLAFNEPGLYPELYDVMNRFDQEHLTEQGARAFTDHLARRLAPLLGQSAEQTVVGATEDMVAQVRR